MKKDRETKKRRAFFSLVIICGILFVAASLFVQKKSHVGKQEKRAAAGQIEEIGSAQEEHPQTEENRREKQPQVGENRREEQSQAGDNSREEQPQEKPLTPEEVARQEKEVIEARFDEKDQVIWKECADESKVVLDFTGDINLAEGVSPARALDSRAGGFSDCLSPDVRKELAGADILMINHEFTMSTKGEPIPGKPYTYRGNPSRVKVLKEMGTDIASLANNHAYDYGPEALTETMEVLTEAGIPYVGAGKNIEEAMKPVYFVANGKVIGIVAATQVERSTNQTKEATGDRAGVLKTLNPDKFIEVIREARKKSDYVIAFVHWGTENTNYYGADQVELAKKFVDAGADVIIGGHTHCLQGCDYINGVPLIYSLGNFWFGPHTVDTGISQVVIDKESGEIEFRFLPCVQKNAGVYMAEGGERQRIIDFMNQIAGSAYIDVDGVVRER